MTDTIISTKICSKCRKKYPATIEYFRLEKRHKDKLHSECRECGKEYQKIYYYQHSEKCKRYHQKYHNTIKGYLRHLFHAIKYRCDNSKDHSYENYGGRGIECRFTFNKFINYVVNDLGIKNIKQIKGLQIDRINNNGHYESGNIRFITAKENCNNRRKK